MEDDSKLILHDVRALSADNKLGVLFKTPVSKLAFEDAAKITAILQSFEKVIKARRSSISKRIEEDFAAGKVKFDLSDAGSKSTKVDIPGVRLTRTLRGGGLVPNIEKVRALLEEKALEPEKVIKPTGERVNIAALRAYCVANSIDETQFIEPTGAQLDEPLLKALAVTGVISEDELNGVYDETPVSTTITCTLEKELQGKVVKELSAAK